MKILKPLLFPLICVLVLGSCKKPDAEENKPEPLIEKPGIPAPNPVVFSDKIKKVVRYALNGTIEDSLLFTYNSQNQLAQVLHGPVINGKFKYKVNYQYSVEATGAIGVIEMDSVLNATNNYDLASKVVYGRNPNTFNGGVSVPTTILLRYNVYYDSLGFIKEVYQPHKNGDYYLNYKYRVLNNNISQAHYGGYPFGDNFADYEYYPHSYNHDLYTVVYEKHNQGSYFWNYGMDNFFEVRKSFFGTRNNSLVKKILYSSGSTHYGEENYQYAFNDNGLVSKVYMSKYSNYTSPYAQNYPMAKKWEIFYY